MSSIDSLIEMINSNTENHPSWTKKLNENIPDWGKLFADPLNWDLLEQIEHKALDNDLCRMILIQAGFKLARHWIKSELRGKMESAKSWLSNNLQHWQEFDPFIKMVVVKEFDNLLDIINAKIWQDLTEDMKLVFVTSHFNREDRGEPFSTVIEHNYQLSKIFNLLQRSCYHPTNHYEIQQVLDENHWLIPLTVPIVFNYYPSISVVRTRIVAEDAGDAKWVLRIDKMIDDRIDACNNNKINEYYEIIANLFKKGRRTAKSKINKRLHYKQNGEGKHLVDLLLEMAAEYDFCSDEMPTILHSNETPPLFIEFPELEKIDKNGEPRNQDIKQPETISIEEVLGCYIASQRTIVLFDRGIDWCVKKNRFSRSTLENIVLIHELAHWLTHRMPGRSTRNWNLDLFNRTETAVHEGLAQLFTWWIAEKTGGEFKEAFERLNSHQSAPYHVFEQYKQYHIHTILISLEELRKLPTPATLQDWEEAMK